MASPFHQGVRASAFLARKVAASAKRQDSREAEGVSDYLGVFGALVRVEKDLCPKEVAAVLGVSPRLAQSLMKSGDIQSYRAGRKLLRTTPGMLRAYRERQLSGISGGYPTINPVAAIDPSASERVVLT